MANSKQIGETAMTDAIRLPGTNTSYQNESSTYGDHHCSNDDDLG
ncbi:hypothetical protein [Nocardia sp. CNY236]|nr:hypothetical protein [Nocardia sp. CNY236]